MEPRLLTKSHPVTLLLEQHTQQLNILKENNHRLDYLLREIYRNTKSHCQNINQLLADFTSRAQKQCDVLETLPEQCTNDQFPLVQINVLNQLTSSAYTIKLYQLQLLLVNFHQLKHETGKYVVTFVCLVAQLICLWILNLLKYNLKMTTEVFFYIQHSTCSESKGL